MNGTGTSDQLLLFDLRTTPAHCFEIWY